MNNYKYNWRGDKAEKWRYQDTDLEDKYRAWMLEQEKKDVQLQREIQAHEDLLRQHNNESQLEMEKKARENREKDPWNDNYVDESKVEQSKVEGGKVDEKDDDYRKIN